MKQFLSAIIVFMVVGTMAAPYAHAVSHEETRERFLRERERVQEETEQHRQEFRERAETVRQEKEEELRQRQVEFREEAEARLSERAKEIAETLAERLNQVNQAITDHYFRYLDTFETVLNKLESRADKAEEAGVDVSDVRAAITEARQAIDDARVSVLAQKEKLYTVEVESLEGIGQAFRAVVLQLRDDHLALRNDLRAVQERVRFAFTLLGRAVSEAATTQELEEAEEEEVVE